MRWKPGTVMQDAVEWGTVVQDEVEWGTVAQDVMETGYSGAGFGRNGAQ